jgi:hypothetical protein
MSGSRSEWFGARPVEQLWRDLEATLTFAPTPDAKGLRMEVDDDLRLGRGREFATEGQFVSVSRTASGSKGATTLYNLGTASAARSFIHAYERLAHQTKTSGPTS